MEKRFVKLIAGSIIFLLCIFSLLSLMNNLQNIDRDSDGLKDVVEQDIGTNPNDEDSDNDDIDDGEEYDYWNEREDDEGDSYLGPDGDVDNDDQPNIDDEDSDNDGLLDGEEIDIGTDPAKADTDNDGLSDLMEISMGTDPLDSDTDDDGILDGEDSSPGYSGGSGDTEFEEMDPSSGVQGGSGQGFDPHSQAPLDRNGQGHDDVTCTAIFNPYLLQMKRYVAYDAIYENYDAYIYDETLNEIELSTSKLDYLFTGSITLEKLTNKPIPIPSVATDANIVSYSFSEPQLTASFFKDSADNYYVKSSDYYYTNQVYLTYVMSAPESYYGLDISEDLTLSDIPSSEIITPPQSVVSKALLIIDELGLTGEKNLKTIVDTFVDYFGGFTAGDIPSAEEEPDIYLAVARSQYGRCYLRSFAFFITANSIGLPTRLVTNDCHAFVEVYIPPDGWTQINLGGLGGCNICNPGGYDPFNDPGGDGGSGGGGSGGGSGGDIIVKPLEKTSTEIIKATTITQKDSYFDVEGYVRDKNRTGISGINVDIYILKEKEEKTDAENKAGSGKTVSGGFFQIRCTVPKTAEVGENHIIAHSLGNNNYMDSWSDPTIEIFSNTTLNLEMASSIGIGDDLLIRGDLVDAGNYGLSEKTIQIYWNGAKIGQATTDRVGEFTFTHATNSLGIFNLTILFEGETYLSSSMDQKQITVKDTSTSLTLSVSPTTVKRNLELALEGKLNSETTETMSYKPIFIFYNGKKVSETSTQSNGEYSTTIKVPNNSSLGNVTIKMHYPGDETHAEANVEKNILVISETSIALEKPDKSYVERNSTLVISGALIDDSSSPIKDVPINLNWTIQNATIKTNQEGEFEFSFDVLPNIKLNYITIKASFEGNSEYMSTSAKKSIEVVIEGYGQREPDENYTLLIVISVIIAILLFSYFYRKRYLKIKEDATLKKIAVQTIKRLKTNYNDREAILNCYNQMCEWLEKKGVKKESYQTPREFAMAIRDYIKVKPRNLYALTHIFEKARYSENDVFKLDKHKAIDALNQIVSAEIVNIKNERERKIDD